VCVVMTSHNKDEQSTIKWPSSILHNCEFNQTEKYFTQEASQINKVFKF